MSVPRPSEQPFVSVPAGSIVVFGDEEADKERVERAERVEVRGSVHDQLVVRMSDEAASANHPTDNTAVAVLSLELQAGLGYPPQTARKAAAAVVAVLGHRAITEMKH